MHKLQTVPFAGRGKVIAMNCGKARGKVIFFFFFKVIR